MIESNEQWLVIILVCTDLRKNIEVSRKLNQLEFLNSKEFFCDYVLESLSKVQNHKNVKTIVVNSILRFNEKKLEKLLFVNEYLINESNKEIEFKQISIPSNLDIINESSITYLFKEIKRSYSANRYLLFTYGHGCMFGIFTESISPLNTVISNKGNNYLQRSINYEDENISKPKFSTKTSKRFGKIWIIYEPAIITFTEDSNHFLTNEELALAIKNSFGKIDILIMNNCLMQNVFTQNAFHGVSTYLIAPQTGITHPGFSFECIFDIISNYTNIQPDQFTEKIVNYFAENAAVNSYEKYAIVGFFLENYEEIKTLLKEFKSFLINAMEQDSGFYTNIYNSLEVALPYDFEITPKRSLYDIMNWIDNMITSVNKYDKTKLEYVQKSIKKLLEKNYYFLGKKVNEINKNSSLFNFVNIVLSGLCIYFPILIEHKSELIEKNYFNDSYSPSLEMEINWKQLIKKYYEFAPTTPFEFSYEFKHDE
jgi:Clostripain family